MSTLRRRSGRYRDDPEGYYQHTALNPALYGFILTYLERQPGFDLVCQYFRNRLVKVCENLHRKLGFDSAFGNETIEGICEGPAQTDRC